MAKLLLFWVVLFLGVISAMATDIGPDLNLTDEKMDWRSLHGDGDLIVNPGLNYWSYFNYSSFYARQSIVKWGGKVYDPLSFKGGENNQFAVAFHLDREIAVSAAQARNGTLLDVAQVEGDQAYKDTMHQIQLDLRGNRSEYYAEPDLNVGRNLGLAAYPAYLQRLHHYYKHGPPAPPDPNPYPSFKNMLHSLLLATEEALGAKLNTTSGFYADDKIYLHISAPWQLNHTYTHYMRHAMNDLNMSAYYGQYQLLTRPWVEWHDHANDIRDRDYYSNDMFKGSVNAFFEARKGAEMEEFDRSSRYRDFECGTMEAEESFRIMKEMKANGSWIEPLRKEVIEWRCRSWGMCLRAKPWLWNYIDVDRDDL